MIVYKATNLLSGKCYVGQTIKELDERKRMHFHQSKTYNGHFPHSIKKYGLDAFHWEVLKECDSKEALDIMETFCIMVHRAHVSEGGYNMTWGGEGTAYGRKLSEDAKKRIGDAHRGNKIWLGKHHTPETKKKLRDARIGKKLSEETKLKISKGNIWNGTQGPMGGRKHSEETKEKMSFIRKGRPSNRKGAVLSAEIRKKLSVSQKKRVLAEKRPRDEFGRWL